MRAKLLTVVVIVSCITVIAGCGGSSIAGTYTTGARKDDYKVKLSLKSDGTCVWDETPGGLEYSGTYKVKGDTLLITTMDVSGSSSETNEYTIKGDTLSEKEAPANDVEPIVFHKK